MILAFEHIVSREFWRRVYPADRSPRNPLARIPTADYAATRREFLEIAPEWAYAEAMLSKTGGKTHSLVFERNEKAHAGSHVSHVWSSNLPEESFYRLDDNLLVSSPEFTFLQHAGVSDVRELIAYGNELCGNYAFDEATPRGFRTRIKPLTSKRKIARFLANASGCYGSKRAKRALRYIVDGSASPMETTIEMANTLPCKKLGGYGLPAPMMNQAIPLDDNAKRIAGRTVCYADMCYPGIKLDIEYHGRFDHDDEESFDSDRARVNGLIEMGFEVIEITHQQFIDFRRYEAIVQHIARRLGKPVRAENLGYLDERVNLRAILAAWNQSAGTPSCVRRS